MALTSSFRLPRYNARKGKQAWDKHTWLYVSVILAVVLGAIVGLVWPTFAIGLEPLGKGFVNLIKMMIAPIIFCTIVVGVGSIAKAATVGRIGGLALLYFMVVIICLFTVGLMVLLVWGVLGVRPREVRFHTGPSLFAFHWREVRWSFGPLPGNRMDFEPERVDPEGVETNGYTRLPLPHRLLAVVSTFLGMLLLALICLSPSRGLVSILSGFAQMLNVFDAYAHVLGFFLCLKTEGFWVALGVLAAKFTALNLLPVPPLPGYQLGFEFWRPRHVSSWVLGVGWGLMFLLWLVWSVSTVIGLLSLRTSG